VVSDVVSVRLPARLLAPLLLAAAVAAGTAACGGDEADLAQQVQSSYAAYAKAVSAKDGGTSSGLVTGSTLDYYAHLRDLALTADRAALAKERVIDQLAVLGMRANIPVGTLRTADPRGVVAAAVKAQVISGGGAGATGLSGVKVEGDSASGTLGVAGGAQEVPMRFRREGGAWKVDLTGLLEPAETSLKAALQREKLTPEGLLQQVMTTRVGAAKAERLWEPLGR
jgi:hypothetical protein